MWVNPASNFMQMGIVVGLNEFDATAPVAVQGGMGAYGAPTLGNVGQNLPLVQGTPAIVQCLNGDSQQVVVVGTGAYDISRGMAY